MAEPIFRMIPWSPPVVEWEAVGVVRAGCGTVIILRGVVVRGATTHMSIVANLVRFDTTWGKNNVSHLRDESMWWHSTSTLATFYFERCPSLIAPEVINVTTSDATTDNNLINMAVPIQCSVNFRILREAKYPVLLHLLKHICINLVLYFHGM